jgi:hypothetical protein
MIPIMPFSTLTRTRKAYLLLTMHPLLTIRSQSNLCTRNGSHTLLTVQSGKPSILPAAGKVRFPALQMIWRF